MFYDDGNDLIWERSKIRRREWGALLEQCS